MKIAILGTSGSGKSTLAKRLGETYGLPVLHMDTVHFLPGWVERPFEEEETIIRRFLDENEKGWVIDGNYTKTCYARRLEEADKIIVLWFSPLVCLWRAVRRWQQNKGRVRDSSVFTFCAAAVPLPASAGNPPAHQTHPGPPWRYRYAALPAHVPRPGRRG